MRHLFAVAAVCLAADAAPARAALISFDDIPGGPFARGVAGDRYRGQGVLLSTDGIAVRAFDDAAAANTPPTWIYGSSDGLLADRAVVIDFVLPGTGTPAATGFVSFVVYDTAAPANGVYTASVFGARGNLLDAVSGTATGATIAFTRPTADVARVVFTPSSDFEGIDTLRFNTPTAVTTPEPATLAVVGCLAAVGFGVRRRLKD